MDYVLLIVLLIALAVFVFWLAGKILVKAGFPPTLAVLLLVPIVNIVMIWVFAFKKWPNIKSEVRQDL